MKSSPALKTVALKPTENIIAPEALLRTKTGTTSAN
jgi:hypothetical protein